MPYCIYLRKSRADAEAEAHGEGETLARHEKILLDLARRRNLPITNIYKEIVSGETIAARPVMQHVLSEVEQGLWEGVLVMEVERLARGDTIDQGIVAQTFKFSDTKIITPIKDYDPNNEYDEEYFEFGLFMSRREYKTINRRLQRGRLASVYEGKYVANTPPYGYERIKLDGEKGFTLREVPEEADTVRLIFELYTTGEKQPDGTYKRLGVSLIARKLNVLSIKPKKGDHWVTPSIRDILINPTYIGKVRWNWRPSTKKMVNGTIEKSRPRSENMVLVDGRHPAIVEDAVFYKAQEYISQNRARPIGERNTVQNPLAGLIVCAACGRKMIRRPYSGRTQEPTLMCADSHCTTVSSKLSVAEARVLEALQDWVNQYKSTLSAQKEKPDASLEAKEKALKRLDAEHETLNKQLNNVYDLLEQGIYTHDEFLSRTTTLSERIKKNRSDYAALEKDIQSARMQELAKKEILPKAERLLSKYYNLPSPAAKNEMLKEVLEKVVYYKEKDGRNKANDPDDIRVVLYPRIPSIH